MTVQNAEYLVIRALSTWCSWSCDRHFLSGWTFLILFLHNLSIFTFKYPTCLTIDHILYTLIHPVTPWYIQWNPVTAFTVLCTIDMLHIFGTRTVYDLQNCTNSIVSYSEKPLLTCNIGNIEQHKHCTRSLHCVGLLYI